MHAVAPRSREFVARVLVQTIPELQQADAYVVMQKAHKQGMAVVGVWVFEIAEAYCASLKSGGLICSVTEESD
jgi:ATP-dependent Clp protease adapter protein ClpS